VKGSRSLRRCAPSLSPSQHHPRDCLAVVDRAQEARRCLLASLVVRQAAQSCHLVAGGQWTALEPPRESAPRSACRRRRCLAALKVAVALSVHALAPALSSPRARIARAAHCASHAGAFAAPIVHGDAVESDGLPDGALRWLARCCRRGPPGDRARRPRGLRQCPALARTHGGEEAAATTTPCAPAATPLYCPAPRRRAQSRSIERTRALVRSRMKSVTCPLRPACLCPDTKI